jgi:hypothetical protein
MKHNKSNKGSDLRKILKQLNQSDRDMLNTFARSQGDSSYGEFKQFLDRREIAAFFDAIPKQSTDNSTEEDPIK